jgi:hypothetical protein
MSVCAYFGLVWTSKKLPTWATGDVWSETINQAWKACDVLIGFSPTGRTSIQIVVTLEYKYRLFVAVIT